ncbi:hypothetical protein H3S89_08495 [Bartonella sp. B10834G6]|uniref:hypothetical protein n=1 Tax=Bartonella apis TaxID=1686310 RepID=UPI0018DE560B|nr:hypothetical protein [Bartonella apis]MBH9982830.1 hypothetical protein [Bartonella apis]
MLESKEKAARSRVRLEKEIGRQVLGNDKMAAHSSIEFKKETLENVSGNKEKAVTLSAGFGKQALQKVTDLKEKAARSRVKHEKDIERQVLGNEKMAARSSVEFKKETLENVSGSKEQEITLTTRIRKQTLQKMLGNETMAAPLTEEAKKKTVQDECKGKLSLENRDVLKTTPAGKSLTKKKAAQKKLEAVRDKKASGILKEAILKAAIKAGNRLGEDGLVSYLEAQALKNASSFLTLLGKVLPAELNSDGQELKTVTKIELVALSPSPKDLTVAQAPAGKKRTACKKHPAGHQKPEINQELSEILKKDD